MDSPPTGLPDPALLVRIENHFWSPDGSVAVSADVALRGAPISGEKFLAHATRQAREFSLRGANMASLSVDLVIEDWPV